MALIGLKCPHCGEEGNIYKSYVGTTVSCPLCHREFVVNENSRKGTGPITGPRQESVKIETASGSRRIAGPVTHTLIYCTACADMSWQEGSVEAPVTCSACGGKLETQMASATEPAILVRKRNGAVQHVDSHEDIADDLLAGRLSSNDALCVLAPPAAPSMGQPDHDKPMPKPQAHWKPIRKCTAFPVRVLFNPVLAYADRGATIGLLSGLALSVLCSVVGFLVSPYLPGIPPDEVPGLGPRLIFMFSMLLCLGLITRGVLAGVAGVVAVWGGLRLLGYSLSFVGASGFVLGYLLGFVLVGLVFAVPAVVIGSGLGATVGILRRDSVPRIPASPVAANPSA